MKTTTYSEWRAIYTGDSTATIDAPHPSRPGMRYTLAKVEDFSPARTQEAARLIAAAPRMIKFIHSFACGSEATGDRGEHICVHAYDDDLGAAVEHCKNARAILRDIADQRERMEDYLAHGEG